MHHGPVVGFFGWALGLFKEGCKADCLFMLITFSIVATLCAAGGFLAGHFLIR